MYHINRKEVKPDVGYMEAIISDLMNKGIRLADCENLKNRYNEMADALKKDIQTKYGIENPNSSKQVIDFVSDMAAKADVALKNDIINVCYDSDKQKWTSDASAFGTLADLGYEFAQDILDYRHVKKYAETIDSVVKCKDKDNLIHPSVRLGKTNRVQYREPALLNIPKAILWNMILPYEESNSLYSVDIKNQEPNLLINMTGAKELRFALESEEGLYETMFKQCFKPCTQANVLIDTFPENRVYSITELKQLGTISPASYMPIRPMTKSVYYDGKKVVGIETVCLGSEKGLLPNLPDTVSVETEDGNIYNVKVTWESAEKKYKKSNDYTLTGELEGLEVRVSKAERKEFKTAWLALSYGASAFGIKKMCKVIDGNRVYNYITKINALKEYRSAVDKKAKALDCRINTIFGTPLYAGEYDDYKALKRVLLDLPIQGSGADILSLLIKRFYSYTKEHKLEDKMWLYYTRHDELIIEVNGEWLAEVGDEKVKEILKDMLEHQIDDWTPFKVEVEKVTSGILKIENDEDD